MHKEVLKDKRRKLLLDGGEEEKKSTCLKNTAWEQVLLIKNNNKGDEVTLSHFPPNYCERGERQTLSTEQVFVA